MKNNGQTTRNSGSGSTFGLLLIGLGGLLLLSNMGIIAGTGGIIGLVVLGGLGVWLLNQYYTGRRQLWLLIGGFAMLGAAAATVTGQYAGAWFLGITGFGFLTVWRESARRWWAVIPAGTMLTLAAVVTAEHNTRWFDSNIVFFTGMALTFLWLYVLPRHAQSWALFPAAASAAVALLVWGSSGSWLLPLLLIGAGLYMVRGNGSFINIGNSNGYGSTYRKPQQPPRDPAGQPAEEDETVREVPRIPDQLTGAGPDIPEGWADERREGN